MLGAHSIFSIDNDEKDDQLQRNWFLTAFNSGANSLLALLLNEFLSVIRQNEVRKQQDMEKVVFLEMAYFSL